MTDDFALFTIMFLCIFYVNGVSIYIIPFSDQVPDVNKAIKTY